jgi:hypothetical protein
MLGGSLRKSSVIENKFRLRPLLIQLKSHNRIHTRRPIFFPPRLHNAFIRNQFDVAAQNHSPKHLKRTANLRADLRGRARDDEVRDLPELFLFEDRLVDTLARRLENNLLMNTLARPRDPIPIRLRIGQARALFGIRNNGRIAASPMEKSLRVCRVVSIAVLLRVPNVLCGEFRLSVSCVSSR